MYYTVQYVLHSTILYMYYDDYLMQIEYLCGVGNQEISLQYMFDPWQICPVFFVDQTEFRIIRGFVTTNSKI